MARSSDGIIFPSAGVMHSSTVPEVDQSMQCPAGHGSDTPLDDQAFDALMSPLGPWPTSRRGGPIAVAVSGGADSTCLAVLAAAWAAGRGLPLLALVVDHRLRPGATGEAVLTAQRLGSLGIRSRILTLHDLLPGPGLAERARIARYEALILACRIEGAVDLLLGHHSFDQAETVLMRRRAGSGADGLAGMAPLLELGHVRLLRPLLSVHPDRLRLTLARRGVAWVEDPSNQDRRAERTRLRQTLAATPALRQPLLDHARLAGEQRENGRRLEAVLLAGSPRLGPEGFALLPPVLVGAGAMAALIRTVGGQAYRPAIGAVERLLRHRRPATLAGTRLLPAGRLGPGWMLLREAAAMQQAVPAVPGACWDNRFRLCCDHPLPPHLLLAAVGAEAAALRGCCRLPAAVLRTLPSLRGADHALLAVPHLGWVADDAWAGVRFRFQPPAAATESTLFSIR